MKRIIVLIWVSLLVFNSPGSASENKSGEPAVTEKEAEVLEEAGRLSGKNLDEAIEFLKGSLNSSSSLALDFTLGNLYFQKDKLEEARACYQKVLDKFPEFNRARANLCRVLIRQEKTDEAIQQFKRILLEGKPAPSTLTLMGYTFLLKNQPVPAETAYRQAILGEPEDVNAYLGLTKSLLMQERFREALKLLEQLLEDDPFNSQFWSLKADAHLAVGEPDEAVIALESARRLKVTKFSDLANLGDLYLNRGQAEDALSAYDQAFSLENPSIDRLLRAIEGFIMTRNPHQADKLLSRVSDLQKTAPLTGKQKNKLLMCQARLAQIKGENEIAFRIYEELLKEDPLNGEVLIAIGNLYREKGKLEEALIVYERVARISGKEVEALICQAQVEVERQRYEKAVELLQAAQSISPQPNVARYLEQIGRLVR
ncbi:MAG: tetratricopeptide repeat protein [Kiritimatiellia bacterium]|nr:tetratricopeptide repeat protein [Kiritimatiellia bacterium]